MDSENYIVCLRPDDSGKWSVYHHKPGYPDLCCKDGTEAECMDWAKLWKFRMPEVDFYHVNPTDRIWRPISI